MLSKNLKVLRYAGLLLSIAAFFSVLIYPSITGKAALTDVNDLQKQMEAVKGTIESGDHSIDILNKYYRLANAVSNCTIVGRVVAPTIKAPFSPQATTCINGALSVADPTYNRVQTISTGTGVGTGVVGNCSLSGSGTATHYDVYSFNLSGCAAFPTAVTAQLCGPAGCAPPGSLDSVLTLYRNVAAGDPLTANGGLPAVFNPASPCTNARAANDDSGTTPTSSGGSTCNQLNPADCLAQCGTSTALSEFKRTLGSGRFTIVVTSFGNTTTLNSYNLYVDVPAAGCALALAPTAASAQIGGRVSNSTGSGISRVTVTLSGGGLSQPMQVSTNGFGYYNFGEVPVGENYVISVASKMYTFNPPTRVVALEDNIANADFVSEQ
ncbi:MAG TPA: carboxypeptidase-like regulatory domain-containing protein [Pyrinomonadaceae bacterium]|jgi:hypothetical protein